MIHFAVCEKLTRLAVGRADALSAFCTLIPAPFFHYIEQSGSYLKSSFIYFNAFPILTSVSLFVNLEQFSSIMPLFKKTDVKTHFYYKAKRKQYEISQ